MEGRETAIGLPPDLEAPSLRSGSLRSPSLRCGSSNSAVFNSIRLPLALLMKVGIFLRPYSNCRWRRCLTDIGTEGQIDQMKRYLDEWTTAQPDDSMGKSERDRLYSKYHLS